jgi:hypothetical protein
MSDSGGFLDGLKSKLNDAVASVKEMAGSPTNPPTNPPPGSADPPKVTPPTEPTVGETILYYLNIASIVIIPILFAVIVANEMIIYRPAVRLFYFILILTLCALFLPFRIIISVYYFIRWAFNKYKKSEGEGSGFFPKIYAFIPWSTEYNKIWPLRYLTPDIGDRTLEEAITDKSFQKDLKKAYYLGEKMVEYFDVLQSANPFTEYDAYKKNFANVTKSLFEMHMPGLKIDHKNKNKEYIIQVYHGGKRDPEFIKIAEHSMVPDIKKSVPPDEKGIPMARYDRETQQFKLVQANGTVAQATPAQMPPTIAQPSQLSPPGPAP